ncbi:MAG TPA: hypothetical protein VJ032_11700 [Thermoanaerobaculia bacterium]|nr:hypothetical protein [Thermoanaerobaculia bacterium]
MLADDSTADLLSATQVKDVIQFEASKSGVTYRVDDRFGGTLAEGTTPTFSAPHGVDLTYRDFNPFKVTVTSTEASVADPNSKAIGDFLDALLAFSKSVVPGGRAQLALRIDGTDQDPEQAFNRWIQEANGRPGIAKVRSEVASLISTTANERDTKTAYVAHETDATLLVKAAQELNESKDLLKALDELAKLLDYYLARSWRNGSSANSDLVIRNVGTDPANQKNIGLSFALKSYTFAAANNTITETTDATLARSLTLRRYRRFVPEVGVAGIYNELKYPKYSTETKDGVLVVKKETSESNVDAAMTMNMFCNCLGTDVIFPGFQLGISKAENYPGIMAGVAFRFSQPKQVSISFGRMVTWFKDLSTLKVGDKVTAQSDIDNDLKRKRSPAAWYFGVQYSF